MKIFIKNERHAFSRLLLVFDILTSTDYISDFQLPQGPAKLSIFRECVTDSLYYLPHLILVGVFRKCKMQLKLNFQQA